MSRNRGSHATDLYNNFKPNSALQRKTLYEEMYMRILVEFSINRFKWENLPDGIDARFMELELHRRALIVFFWNDDFDKYMALRGSGAGRWNMYDNPTTFQVTGNTFVNKRLQSVTGTDNVPAECVPIWANALRIPDWDLLTLYSSKLAEIERTIEINLLAMRTPYIVAVDDTEKQTFINAFRQIQEGQPVIFGTDALKSLSDKISVMPMTIDREVVLNLHIVKAKIWAECMTFLGINNANQEKRERLVADEVSANDAQVSAAQNMAMNARESAVKLINERYGLNVTVEWRDTEVAEMPGMSDNLDEKVTTESTGE